MKRILVVLTVIGLFLAACGLPAAAGGPGTPSPEPTTPPTDGAPATDDLPPAVQAAREALAALLGIPVDQIRVVDFAAVEWPDSCLGVMRIDMICAQVITPGFRVVLEADGAQYEYHTNADGSHLLVASASTAKAAEQAAREALARALGLPIEAVTVLDSRISELPDACLGVALPGEMCAEVVTPGYVIHLEAEGRQYEYYATLDASMVRAASMVLTWQREGGIAGFCDALAIYRSGEVVASSCTQSHPTTGTLTEAEREQLDAWLAEYSLVNIEHADPAEADAMRVALYLEGTGSAEPTEAEQQAMLDWAQAVYNRLQQ